MGTEVDALIVGLLERPATGALLRHDAPHFQGLSAADTERVRGHLLASFEERGVPPEAVAVVAEELRTGSSAVVLAGAARAVRGLDAAADPAWRGLLAGAAERLATRDVFVRWQAGAVAPSWLRTARGEITAVLDELSAPVGGSAVAGAEAPGFSLSREAIAEVTVEDQDGARLSLADLLDRTTVLAFFYTRCMNPAKCSLTVTRLAALTARSAEPVDGPGVVAMSYDPDYDVPHRLRAYGEDRAFVFGERARFVRAVDGWQSVRAMFRLRVGYGPVTVNEHAREVFSISPGLVARGLPADALADPGALAHAGLRG